MLEKRQLEQDLQRERQYAQALSATALAVVTRNNLTDVLDTIVTHISSLLDTPDVYLDLVNTEAETIDNGLSVGIYNEYDLPPLRMKRGEGVDGKVWESGQTIIVDDYDTWPGRSLQVPLGKLHQVVGVPVKLGDVVLGVIGATRASLWFEISHSRCGPPNCWNRV